MSPLREVRLVDISTVADSRGRLTVLEQGGTVPFDIRRVFFMHHMEADRGGHAHRDTEQVVLAAAGSFRITLTDAESSLTYVLDDPSKGVYMPPMVFVTLTQFSPGAICLVLASTVYDMGRSIRTYEDFQREVVNS